MATPSNKRKQIASVFHFSPASKPLMCTVRRDTGGKQIDITVLWFKPRVRHLSHCGWHFTGFKQELWELLALTPAHSISRLLRQEGDAGLSASARLAWEAGTKHLHKKSSWAPHYYLCIPPERERQAGRYPARVKYYRGRTHQDELRQHKASTRFRGLKGPQARAKW